MPDIDRLRDERFSENHERCYHCGAYTDLCECNGGIGPDLSDIPETTKSWWKKARLVTPHKPDT